MPPSSTQYLAVKNWTEFQHYKDGRPVHWIKLHLSVLDDYDFDLLDEITQLHLIKIWALAAKNENRIPADSKWISRKIGARKEVDIKQLISSGFLIYTDGVRNRTKPYDEADPSVPRERVRGYKEEKDSAALPPTIWDAGVAQGIPRSMVGKWIGAYGEQRVADCIAAIAVKRPGDPKSWGAAWLQDRPKNQIPKDPNLVEAWAKENGHPLPKAGEEFFDYKKRLMAHLRAA